MAVIRELENWRYLLEDAKFKFEVWTDYKNLEYFIKTQKLNRRQACWALYLSRFDFTLEKNNDNQTLIKEQCSNRYNSKNIKR